jgi:hypothetical protein
MTRTKLGLLGLFAIVIGMASTFTGAAQGATLSWLILNAAKTTATELKALLVGEKDSEHLTWDFEVAGIKVAKTCTNFELKGANLEAGGKLTEGTKITFTGCKVYKTAPLTEPFECTVRSTGAAVGTVELGEVKGGLALVGAKLLLKVEPKAGPTGSFATVRFEGEKCVLPEVNQVHGTVYLEDCENKATTHLVKHLLQAEPLNTAMYVGGHSAKQLEVTKILGSVWVMLAGAHAGLSWAAMDV